MDNKKRSLLPRIPSDFWITTGRRFVCGLLILLWALLICALIGGLIFLVYICFNLGGRMRHHPIMLAFCGMLLFRFIVGTSKMMWCGGLQWIMENGVIAFIILIFWLTWYLLLYLLGIFFLYAIVAIFWLFIWDVCFGIDQFDVVKGIAIIPLVCLGIYVIVVLAFCLWNGIAAVIKWIKNR